ncbi:hypothetical protein [Amycolatopsis tolypomycina]
MQGVFRGRVVGVALAGVGRITERGATGTAATPATAFVARRGI